MEPGYENSICQHRTDDRHQGDLEFGKTNPGFPLLEKSEEGLIKVPTNSKLLPKPSLRAVLKNGTCNVQHAKVPTKKFVKDFFTTLVDLKWRWTITIFSLGFVSSWTIFAVAWWLVAYAHGDLEINHLPIHQKASNWTPCVIEITGFMSCFLFSVETQHTTGYGLKAPTDECPEAVLVMCIQNIVGLIIEAFLVGIVFAKMTRPKLRAQTIQFSKFAVICMRENNLCLMFRVGDMRQKSRLIEAKIKARVIRAKRTKEGESLRNFQTKLAVTADDCSSDLFLFWPMTIVHEINVKSPFYRLSPVDLLGETFEIVVTLEGTIESTDQKTQARTSYLSNEVLWGHRFEEIVTPNIEKGGYMVDYSKFNKTTIVDTPLCCEKYLADLLRKNDNS